MEQWTGWVIVPLVLMTRFRWKPEKRQYAINLKRKRETNTADEGLGFNHAPSVFYTIKLQ